MRSFYQRMCRNLLPLADLATRSRTMEFYALHEEAQWWDRDRLQEYQDALVRETVQTAYREVPFYRELYDRHGVEVESVTGVAALPSLPIVGKELLRPAYPNRCTRKTPWGWQEFCTSGSSGKPFAVRVDALSLSQARALMLMRATYSGWEIGEPFLQTGMTLDRGIVKRVKDLLLRVEYVSAFDLSDRVLDRYLDLMEKKGLQYLMGYAGSLFCLAERAGQRGLERKLRGIVSWGDNLYDNYRARIEKVFQCRVTDTYGCGEGIQVAAQCGMGDGAYHIFMPHVAVEVVDDEGAPVPAGEAGHILLTRLDPGAMPLVRYRVGDIGRKSPAKSCGCGRGLEMLARIEGRDTDVIVTPNGNRLIVHFFTGIFEYYQSVNSFKVIQERPEEILVQIVPAPGFRDADWDRIKGEILQKGDPDLGVRMELVEDIPLERSNKRRFVVSRLAGH